MCERWGKTILAMVAAMWLAALPADRAGAAEGDHGAFDISVMGMCAPLHPNMFGGSVMAGVRLARWDQRGDSFGALVLDVRTDFGMMLRPLVGVRIQGDGGRGVPYFVARGGAMTYWGATGAAPYATIGGGFLARAADPVTFRLEINAAIFDMAFYKNLPIEALAGVSFRF